MVRLPSSYPATPFSPAAASHPPRTRLAPASYPCPQRLLTLLSHRKYNGHTLDELPFRAVFGIWGSYICVLINVIALVASFYTALYPLGGPYLTAEGFFLSYLAGPLLIFLYLCWKVYSWFVHPEHRPLYVKIKDIDIYTGMREEQRRFVSGEEVGDEVRRSSVQEFEGDTKRQGVMGWVKASVRSVL